MESKKDKSSVVSLQKIKEDSPKITSTIKVSTKSNKIANLHDFNSFFKEHTGATTIYIIPNAIC